MPIYKVTRPADGRSTLIKTDQEPWFFVHAENESEAEQIAKNWAWTEGGFIRTDTIVDRYERNTWEQKDAPDLVDVTLTHPELYKRGQVEIPKRGILGSLAEPDVYEPSDRIGHGSELEIIVEGEEFDAPAVWGKSKWARGTWGSNDRDGIEETTKPRFGKDTRNILQYQTRSIIAAIEDLTSPEGISVERRNSRTSEETLAAEDVFSDLEVIELLRELRDELRLLNEALAKPSHTLDPKEHTALRTKVTALLGSPFGKAFQVSFGTTLGTGVGGLMFATIGNVLHQTGIMHWDSFIEMLHGK